MFFRWKYYETFPYKTPSIQKPMIRQTLRGNCPSTEIFLVRIFLHSDGIRRFTPEISVFSPNTGKYGPEKKRYLDTFYAEKYNGKYKMEIIKILLVWGFCQHTRCNEFVIDIPGLSQCESDNETDIPRTSSDILGISN